RRTKHQEKQCYRQPSEVCVPPGSLSHHAPLMEACLDIAVHRPPQREQQIATRVQWPEVQSESEENGAAAVLTGLAVPAAKTGGQYVQFAGAAAARGRLDVLDLAEILLELHEKIALGASGQNLGEEAPAGRQDFAGKFGGGFHEI